LVLRLIGPGNDRRDRFVRHFQDVFVANVWRQIDLDIHDGRLQVRIDGTVAMDRDLPERNWPRNWNSSHILALGNEHTGRRPWLGEIAEARIIVGEQQDDLLRSEAMRIPAEFWSARYAPRLDSIIRLEISREYAVDYIVNLVCFMPLGFLLAARRQRGWPVLYAALLCGAASLGVELVQVFFARDTSVYDWLLNTGGGSAGAVIAGLLKKRHILSPGRQRAAGHSA
ncbi:MAG: VanZ family protein, partial [Woeseiaceae bacterium]